MPMTDEEIREMFKQQKAEFDCEFGRLGTELGASISHAIRKQIAAAFAQQVERPPTTAPHFRLPKGFNLAPHQHVALCSHCAGGTRPVWFVAPGQCPACCTPAPTNPRVSEGAEYGYAVRHDDLLTFKPGDVVSTDGRQLVYCLPCAAVKGRVVWFTAPGRCPVCKTPRVGDTSAQAAPQGEIRPASGTMVTLRPMSAIELADGEFMARCRACTKEGRRIWFVCRRDEPTGTCPHCGNEQPLYEQTP